MEEITILKAQIFDIIAEQERLAGAIRALEAEKQRLLRVLDELQRQEKDNGNTKGTDDG